MASNLTRRMTPSGRRRPATGAAAGLIVVACCLLLAAAGCGRGHGASVSGRVTLDGEPLDTGTVTFHPVGDGPTAYGGIHPNGSYQAKTGTQPGMPPGEYRVTVLAATEPPTDGPSVPGEMITPSHYADPEQSGLRVTVERGSNRFDFPLTSE